MSRITAYIAIIAISLGAVIAASALGAIIFKLCWNYAMVALFQMPEVNLLQSFCLLLLAHMVIKSRLTPEKPEKKTRG
jgi:hypothetical protein